MGERGEESADGLNILLFFLKKGPLLVFSGLVGGESDVTIILTHL